MSATNPCNGCTSTHLRDPNARTASLGPMALVLVLVQTLWHCIPLAPGTAATHLGTHALGLLVPARHQLGWWPLTGVKTHWLVHNMIWTTTRIFVFTSKWVKIYIYRCLQEQDQSPKIADSANTEQHFLAFSDCSSVSRISSPFRLAHWQISALLEIREASKTKTAHLVVFNYQCIMYTPMFLGGSGA